MGRGQRGLASCLWDPHKTGPAAVNPLYCKGKEAQKMGNHIRALLAFTPNEDLEGKKKHQEAGSSSDCPGCSTANKLLFIWSYSSPVVMARHKRTGKKHSGELKYWKG